MESVKSYCKRVWLLTGVCAASLTICGLSSCGDGSGKPLSEVAEDPAGTYRKYLSDIRSQKSASFKELTLYVRQWQELKDSVFFHLRKDSLIREHPDTRSACVRLHDSIRNEFSRLVLSKPRTYQELLSFKNQFSSYARDTELLDDVQKIRPFFRSLDDHPAHKGNRTQVLSAYRSLLSRTNRAGIHSTKDLRAFITKEDAVFRAFLVHLHELDGEGLTDVTRNTEQCCSQILLAAERKEITYREAMLYLVLRTNRRQIQNMQTCMDDVRNKRVKTPVQAHAYIWMLVQPYSSLDAFSMALLSEDERKQLDRMAAQTPAVFKSLSRILQSEGTRLSELPGMLMEIFIHTL